MDSGDSALGRRGMFSCPSAGRVMCAAALPAALESPSGRRGLLDLVVRVRGDERNGAERRRVNRFVAGAACVASGDSG
jgi:hypothetical protein